MEIKVRSAVLMATVKEDREYIFSIPFGAPYEEAKLVAQDLVNGIDELRKQNEKLVNEAKGEEANLDSEPKSE